MSSRGSSLPTTIRTNSRLLASGENQRALPEGTAEILAHRHQRGIIWLGDDFVRLFFREDIDARNREKHLGFDHLAEAVSCPGHSDVGKLRQSIPLKICEGRARLRRHQIDPIAVRPDLAQTASIIQRCGVAPSRKTPPACPSINGTRSGSLAKASVACAIGRLARRFKRLPRGTPQGRNETSNAKEIEWIRTVTKAFAWRHCPWDSDTIGLGHVIWDWRSRSRCGRR